MNKSSQLNQKDVLTDVLTAEKTLVKMYGTAMTEGSGVKFRSVIKNDWSCTVADQYEVYKQMEKCGFYQVMPADKASIDKQKETFKKVLPELKN